jgi:hypothetical protein
VRLERDVVVLGTVVAEAVLRRRELAGAQRVAEVRQLAEPMRAQPGVFGRGQQQRARHRHQRVSRRARGAAPAWHEAVHACPGRLRVPRRARRLPSRPQLEKLIAVGHHLRAAG